MITVEPKAAARVRELLGKMGRPNIRIRVTTGGCSGLEYKVEPADAPGPNDLAFEQEGFRILVEREHLIYVAGSALSLEQNLMQSKFLLKNPNAVATCSCGESFSVGGDEVPVPCCKN